MPEVAMKKSYSIEIGVLDVLEVECGRMARVREDGLSEDAVPWMKRTLSQASAGIDGNDAHALGAYDAEASARGEPIMWSKCVSFGSAFLTSL